MAKGKSTLVAKSKSIDPTLDALFSTSSGPVKAPSKSRYTNPPPPKQKKPKEEPEPTELSSEDEDDEGSVALESDEAPDASEEDIELAEEDGTSDEEPSVPVAIPKKQRKRKRNDGDDLESKYFSKLADDDFEEPVEKKKKGEEDAAEEADASLESSDAEEPPKHESLGSDAKASELEKANRTVFLANVSAEAITSKSAKKTLLTHLSTILDEAASPPQKIESIRFRSVAFAGSSMPKRAAYITKALMDSTTKSANAYVVYSSPAAARKAVAELNGTEILGRHVRVDSVAHPGAVDHRRCVFVGNLGFVDDETVLNTGADGETTTKKRSKIPSDVEEGLWRTFSQHAGKVENVRVVRDPKTRVGKGIAYVQFYDINDVEGALILNGKKYPPMLPRPMRVTRAKAPHKTALAMERKSKGPATNGAGNTKYKPKATSEQQSLAGRAGKLLGRAGAALQRRGGKPTIGNGSGVIPKDMKTPEEFVFEGRRATSRDALSRDLKGKKPKGKGKGKGRVMKKRGARRAEEWRKTGPTAKA